MPWKKVGTRNKNCVSELISLESWRRNEIILCSVQQCLLKEKIPVACFIEWLGSLQLIDIFSPEKTILAGSFSFSRASLCAFSRSRSRSGMDEAHFAAQKYSMNCWWQNLLIDWSFRYMHKIRIPHARLHKTWTLRNPNGALTLAFLYRMLCSEEARLA